MVFLVSVTLVWSGPVGQGTNDELHFAYQKTNTFFFLVCVYLGGSVHGCACSVML